MDNTPVECAPVIPRKRAASTVSGVSQKRPTLGINNMEAAKIINLSRTSAASPDVEINVLGDIYQLHSSILCTSSKFFDCSLSQSWRKPENTHSKNVDGIKFRYYLKLMDETDYVGCFEPIPSGRQRGAEEETWTIDISAPPASDTKVLATSRRIKEIKLIYAAIFGIFYHQRFGSNWDNDEPASETTTRIVRVIDAAEFLSCLKTISVSIEAYLLTWSWQPLGEEPEYKNPIRGPMIEELHISNRVQDLLPIVIKLRSRALFNDCFVHFVGMLELAEQLQECIPKDLIGELEAALLELPNSIAKAILKEKRDIQRKLNCFHDTMLAVAVTDGSIFCPESIEEAFCTFDTSSSREKIEDLSSLKNVRLYGPPGPAGPIMRDSDWNDLKNQAGALLACQLQHEISHKYRHFVCAKTPEEMPWDDFREW